MACGKILLKGESYICDKDTELLVQGLINTIKNPNSGSSDSQRLSLQIFGCLARQGSSIIKKYISVIAPVVFAHSSDSITPIKTAAETTWKEIFIESGSNEAYFDTIENGPSSRMQAFTARLERLVRDDFNGIDDREHTGTENFNEIMAPSVNLQT